MRENEGRLLDERDGMENNRNNKVIDLRKYAKGTGDYRERLKEFADELSEMSNMCFDNAINLAALGKWKDWDKTIHIGATFRFSEDQLLDTGDEIVTRAVQLRIDAEDLIERINAYLTGAGS